MKTNNLLNEERPDEALALAEELKARILRQYPPESFQVSAAWKQIGRAWFHKGDYNKAVIALDTALYLERKFYRADVPLLAPLYNDLGVALFRAGQYTRSIACLEKSIELNSGETPEKASAWNHLGHNYLDLGKYRQALACYQSGLDINLKLYGELHSNVAGCYNNFGTTYLKNGDYLQASLYYEKALTIFDQLPGAPASDILATYNNAGQLRQILGDTESAIRLHQKGLSMAVSRLGREHSGLANCYNNLGLDYWARGDAEKAVGYFEQALAFFLKSVTSDHSNIATTYNNLATCYTDLNNYELAEYFLKKCLDSRLKNPDTDPLHLAYAYNNLGALYQNQFRYQEAINAYQEAVAQYIKLPDPAHPDLVTIYRNMAGAFMESGDTLRAESFALKSLQISNQVFGKNSPDAASSYTNLAYIFQREGRFTTAETYLDSALTALNYKAGSRLEDINSLPTLASALRIAGDFYLAWFKYGNDRRHLLQSRAYYAAGLTAQDALSRSTSPGSGVRTRLDALNILRGGVTVNCKLYALTDSVQYLQEAFRYSERGKGFQLYEALQNAHALQYAGIPDSLVRQEHDLQTRLAFWEKKRWEQHGTDSPADSVALAGNSARFETSQRYESLRQRLEKEFPDYYRLKYNFAVTGPEQIQQSKLAPDQAMISYSISDSSIFIFVLTRDRMDVREVRKNFPLERWVSQLRESISRQWPMAKMAEQNDLYITSARQLYEVLIKPVEQLLRPSLVIVPDGVLGYLPFEALLTGRPGDIRDYSRYPYLIKERTISYNYSATLLQEMTEKKHRKDPANSILAVAPFYTGDSSKLYQKSDSLDFVSSPQRDTLRPLKNSGTEVAKIKEMLGGEAWTGRQATAGRFIAEAPGYRILHFATHARADDRTGDYAYLAFSSPDTLNQFEKLYARDIYTLPLNADLVVLSACESGTGELRKGEGIISLARAFAYAGAKSLVTSLWNVNDYSGAYLIERFYYHLKTPGMKKDEALRQAKLDLLKKNKSTALPYYWAPFICIGDMKAVY
ncbi:MAG TPA: CHAT domain-containing protein [Flavilitoribacter sp.]|nr:CHAT domain-containing protein [Flavilitoribacter sp.]